MSVGEESEDFTDVHCGIDYLHKTNVWPDGVYDPQKVGLLGYVHAHAEVRALALNRLE